MNSDKSVGVRRSDRKRRTSTWLASQEWADETETISDPDLLPSSRLQLASACDTGKLHCTALGRQQLVPFEKICLSCMLACTYCRISMSDPYEERFLNI